MFRADVAVDGVILLDDYGCDDVMTRENDGMIRALCSIWAAMQTAADAEENNAIFFFQKRR